MAINLLPSDWPSFVSGVAIGAVAAFLTGFLKKMGEDAWTAFKARYFPNPPDPIQVARDFDPSLFEPGACSWVPKLKMRDFEAKGYTFYPHPERGAKCFRVTQLSRASPETTEYLMVKPGAQRIPRN